MQKAPPPVSMVTLRPQLLLTKPAMMEKKAPAGVRQDGQWGVYSSSHQHGGGRHQRPDACHKGHRR